MAGGSRSWTSMADALTRCSQRAANRAVSAPSGPQRKHRNTSTDHSQRCPSTHSLRCSIGLGLSLLPCRARLSHNGDEAVKFLKFFFQPENYIRYLQTAPIHLLPVSTKILEDERYKATPDFAKWQFWVDAQN